MPYDTYATPFIEHCRSVLNGLLSSSQMPGINTKGIFPVLPTKYKAYFHSYEFLFSPSLK